MSSSTLDNHEQEEPEQYVPEDIGSALSIQSTRQTNNYGDMVDLGITRTETVKSLHERGLDSEIPMPPINYPPVEDPIFPEEYTLETDTGLVKVSTLHSLGRVKSRKSQTPIPEDASSESSDEYGQKREKEEEEGTKEGILDPEIEFVTFKINDPENPLNWSMKYRCFYTFILAMLVIASAYGSSCLAGGLFLINEKFDVSSEVSTLAISLMVIGFAVGPLLWAPMSEQLGRRPVYFLSFFLYTIFNIPVALAKNIGTVLVCRFICGVMASSSLTIVGASIVDIHSSTRGLAIAIFSFCPYSGPVIGDVVNGFISVHSGRYDLMVWVNMAFAGVMWIIISLMPETYAPVILKKRAKKLRKETGNMKIMTEQEATPMNFKEMVNNVFYRPLKFVVEEPVLDLVCAFIALIYALLYAFFFAFPAIFVELYDYKDDTIGMMYIPILIGAIFALFVTVILEKKYDALCRRRCPTPEDRLVGAMIGAPFPAISLFILGATSYKHIIWVGPASSGIAFGFGMVLLYYSLNNYILDTYQKYAASALGTKVFLRSAGGAAFPLFTTQMYSRLGLNWASWLLAFISLGMMLIPFAFYKFGGGLRAKLCKEDYSAKLQQIID